MITIIEYDTSGHLIPGVFYELEVAPQFDLGGALPVELPPSGSIDRRAGYSGDEFAWIEGLYELTWKFDCPANCEHQTGFDRSRIRVDLFGGPRLADFVPDMFHGLVVISEAFCSALDQKAFRGCLSTPVPIAANQSRLSAPKLRVLTFLGRPCVRPPRVSAPEPNSCPFCQWEPIVCPACHDVTYNCPKCGQRIVVGQDEIKACGDPRFAAAAIPPGGHVVEGTRWDGSDFISALDQGVVTKRVVDWLRESGSGPFLAKPCWVNIAGCDQAQLKELERIGMQRNTMIS